jgi:predicted RND superfamily exporter protein
MNMGAAMIAAVSMGLAIDGAIHYLIAFQRARHDGMSVGDALHFVQQAVGRAMVFSTLALIVGFSCLASSQFVPTIYFGLLVSLLMFTTMIGTLVWLPLLVRWVVPDRPLGRQRFHRPDSRPDSVAAS